MIDRLYRQLFIEINISCPVGNFSKDQLILIYDSFQNLDTKNDNGIYSCRAENGAPAGRANTTKAFALTVWCEY